MEVQNKEETLKRLCKGCENFPCGREEGKYCNGVLAEYEEYEGHPPFEDERLEELRSELRFRKLFRTRINWGFWILIGGFTFYLITQYVIRPLVTSRGW